jgi:ribose 5-phosphate isomerase B
VIDERTIRDMVRRVVLRTVAAAGPAPRRARSLITQRDVEETPVGGSLEVPPGAIVSPLARQAALERKVTLEEPAADTEHSDGPESGARHGAGSVAVAADHGGYGLKNELADHLRDRGYAVIDCGTGGPESVDYPDYALAAAQLVAEGRAWRAIIVDGAGIGSCMAANKVPGVRAALCYDEATAVNSREHNHANVLTLGAGMIGAALARQIVDTWLETPAGKGRHARRVAKIMDIEQRYSRK